MKKRPSLDGLFFMTSLVDYLHYLWSNYFNKFFQNHLNRFIFQTTVCMKAPENGKGEENG